jgi:hypothetical protein
LILNAMASTLYAIIDAKKIATSKQSKY